MPVGSLHSLHSKAISLSHKEIMNLSIDNLDWDSTDETDSYDSFDYLNDDSSLTHDEYEKAYDSDSFSGSFRWTDRNRFSDENPEVLRRRQSVDQLDEEDNNEEQENVATTSKCFTKLGGRISLLCNSPTKSPRCPLTEFIAATRQVDVTGFVDDLSLDDSIYTIEDEMQFMCATLEETTI